MKANVNNIYTNTSYLKLPRIEREAIQREYEKVLNENIDEGYELAQRQMLYISILALQMCDADENLQDLFMLQYKNMARSTRKIKTVKEFDEFMVSKLKNYDKISKQVSKLLKEN